jgi:7-cyano-7-deazaguanine synthase
MKLKRAVVLLSGGLDSSTLLYQLLYEDFDVVALTVDYGQRHAVELAHASVIATMAGVPFKEVHLARALAPIFAGAGSSQVGKMAPVPTGHYADETMKTTIVPNRNMMLLSIAGALAVAGQAQTIAYAAHAGDHAIYPDCRPEFYTAMNIALQVGNDPPISLYAPFINLTKTDIVKRAVLLKVPLAQTYSCYAGEVDHCGVCGTCFERKEAFRDAGVDDPTRYSA